MLDSQRALVRCGGSGRMASLPVKICVHGSVIKSTESSPRAPLVKA